MSKESILTKVESGLTSSKTVATKVAMATAFLLMVLKASVGILTGSLSILSSAIDSFLDIASSFFNFIAIKKAEQPADKDHQYGHGKYESLATFIQAIIIFLSGAFILISAWNRFKDNSHTEISQNAFIVMIISIIATVFLTIYLKYVAKRLNSSVLMADSMHYAIDLYTNIGILLGLIIIKLTGLLFIDAAIAMIIAIYIMFSAVKLLVEVSRQLLDKSIEDETYRKLINVLTSFGEYHLDFHRLRTRSSGNETFIDMHLTLCKALCLADVHKITDRIEQAIMKAIPNADVMIHPEPCNHTGESNSCNSNRIKEGLKKLEQEEENN